MLNTHKEIDLRILAVDDDPAFSDIFASLLRQLGEVDLTIVDSGPEALHQVQESAVPYDCIFIDIQMPEMDGIELTGVLRVLDNSRNAQIVMVTSMSERHFIDLAFRAGADDYITKPLEVVELKARLGSIRRIHVERRDNLAMQKEITRVRLRQHKYEFEDFIPMPNAAAVMPRAAMQNYISALGRLRQASSLCIGFHVENAPSIYVRTDDDRFAQILQDVAGTIFDVLKRFNMMVAYLGSGDFACVISPAQLPSPTEIEMIVNDELHAFADLYPLGCYPVVRVGEIIGKGLFSRRPMNELIDAARISAQTRKADEGRSLRRSA